jgi:hypothetical protein
MKKYTITLSDEQYSLLIKAVGRHKSWLNDGGFFRSAHSASDLLSHIKNNVKEEVVSYETSK